MSRNLEATRNGENKRKLSRHNTSPVQLQKIVVDCIVLGFNADMLKIYPYEQLGNADYGWLKACYHFSFASYYNPQRTGFGTLIVINEDIVKAGTGFDTHPHRDMEIKPM